MIWRERIGGEHYSSPLFAAGEDYLVLAGGQFDEGFNASPAVAGNAMILRTETRLYCIEAGAAR